MSVTGQVLIVDDDDDTIELLKIHLSKEPYQIFYAKSAAEGLDILSENDIQVVLSDLHMPAVDGSHFLYEVRKTFPQVVRLVISGNTDANEILDAVNAGHIYSFIQKPWKKESLIVTISNGLEKQRMSQERDDLLMRSHKLNQQLLELNDNLEKKFQKKWHTIELLNHNISSFIFKKEVTQNNLAELLNAIFDKNVYTLYRHIGEREMVLMLDNSENQTSLKTISPESLKSVIEQGGACIKDSLQLNYNPVTWELQGLNRSDDFFIITSKKEDNLSDYLPLIRLYLSKIKE